MAHSSNLLPLKLLVISLGLVLIGGTIFVFAAIAHKAGRDMGMAHCPDVTLHLAGKGTLSGITPQGDKVQLTLTSGADTRILTVDRCGGTILQTLTVAP